MDKNAIKKYAVWARRELISRVSQRAALYEITDKGYGDASADSVLGRVMSAEEKRQRQALIAQIREKGFEQVMEEIAYTWFNRFIALRFMEVNGYLPSRVRVFTDDENDFKPQILAEAINMELEGLDMEKVYALKNANDDDALFKYMIIVQCNALSSILPGMFQRISDYTELLFPDNLLREGSAIEQMVSMIPEKDWTDQVQIIGWLYQYYNTEPKDKVFADLKKNIKISKDNIPAATQLFTPDWIVRYMVENSLGRLWLEGHPNDELKASWKYYLDEAGQEPEVQAQLAEIRKQYAALKPEDIRAIDPCQGSGHILAYMFDVLVQIYESYGYTAREAAAIIVENNIWGLDIDERAAQLSYFSVVMKARQYDRRFFSRGIQPHVYAILESNNIDPHCVEYFADGREVLKSAMDTIMKELHDAKEYGSILNVTQVDFDALYARFAEIRSEDAPNIYAYHTLETLLPVVQVAQTMAQKYSIVVTNPPYMSSNGMSASLSNYVKDNYADSKSDLFAVFMERCLKMNAVNGYTSMITQHSWMFLESFESLRGKILRKDLVNLLHLGAHAFEEIGGEIVQTTAFVIGNRQLKRKATYVRVVDYADAQIKESEFFNSRNVYYCDNKNFSIIPKAPVSYWISDRYYEIFSSFSSIGDHGNTKKGVLTGNDKRFVRLWFEVDYTKMGRDLTDYEDMLKKNFKWIPATGGGQYRKWYGNFEKVINMENDAYEIRYDNANNYRLRESSYYFRECSTWSEVSGKGLSMRYVPQGIIFGNSGPVCFWSDHVFYWIGLMNSKTTMQFLRFLSPTLTFGPEQIKRIPCGDRISDEVELLAKRCVQIAKTDWDAYETSWEFKKHPLVRPVSLISDAFTQWKEECDERFREMKSNEEQINKIFIDYYGLSSEMDEHVDERDISLNAANLQTDIKSFISYAVGCMFGRYSLDEDGLVYAGGKWDASRYQKFIPDQDGILPICDDEYFADDILIKFIEFVRQIYGSDTLEENLRFIANAIGGKGSPREVIRNYFITDFYSDHLKTYQRRPIYWLFDSGKKNGFKCLVYMHRYKPDTIARIRTDYVHEQQERYRTVISDLEKQINGAATADRVKLSKRLQILQAQADEVRFYEEKIHHLADQMKAIELDNGVRENYVMFKDVLSSI